MCSSDLKRKVCQTSVLATTNPNTDQCTDEPQPNCLNDQSWTGWDSWGRLAHGNCGGCARIRWTVVLGVEFYRSWMAPIVCGGWDAYHRRICTSDESFLLLLDNDIELPPFCGLLIYSGDRDEIMCDEQSTTTSYVLKLS